MDAAVTGMEPDGQQPVGLAAGADHATTQPAPIRLEVLHDLDHALIAARSIEELGDTSTDVLRSATRADRIAIWLGDPQTGEVRLLASDPPASRGHRLHLDAMDSVALTHFLAHEAVEVEVGSLGADDALRSGLPSWVQSWCAVPLADHDGVLGVLTMSSRHPGGFDPGLVATVRSAGDHLAMALRKELLREELLQTVDRTSAILDAAPNGVVLVGSSGQILHANRGAASLVGVSAASLIGRHIEGIIPDFEATAAGLLGGRQRTGDQRPELPLRREDGVLVTVEVGLARLRLSDGPGMAVILVDTAERRALERRLLQAEKMEMAGQVASMAAHDFRNYLTAIGGFAELLAEDAATNAYTFELDQIMTAVARGQESVAAMLTFARPADADDLIEAAPTFFHRVLPLLASLARPRADVELELAAGLPDLAMSPGALTQILMNLVTNARDAMPQGGTVRIRARPESPTGWARRASDAAVVEVADTGVGMDPATMRRAFEPFFTTKRPGDGVGEGSGLGLTSVRLQLARIGGAVDVDSAPGAGTTVRLRIPIRALVSD